jgi:hypothetical protein
MPSFKRNSAVVYVPLGDLVLTAGFDLIQNKGNAHLSGGNPFLCSSASRSTDMPTRRMTSRWPAGSGEM